MEAVQYIVFVQVLLVLFSTTATVSTTTETISSTSTTASPTTTPQSTTETPSTSSTLTTFLTSTIATTPTDDIISTPTASTSTSTADTTSAKLTTTPRIQTTSSTVEETSMSPQGTTQSKEPDSTTTMSNPTTTTTTTQTAITTATKQLLSSKQFPSSYSPSTENDTMTPTTQTTLTTDRMTSTSRPDQSTSYSTTGESTTSAGTTEHVGMSTTTARISKKTSVSTTSAGTTGHSGVSTATAKTTKHVAELTSSEGTTANTPSEDEKQVIILLKDIDALKKKNSLLVYIIIGLAVALGIVFMTTIICCVYSSGRRGNALIDDGIDNDIKTSAYVRTRRPFGSLSNDVVNLFNRATRRFSARDSRENQLDSQPRYTFSNKLAEEDNEETEKVSEEKDTTKSVEQVEMKEVTEVQTEVVNETVVDGGISRDQKAFASLKNGDINSKLPKSQPCVVPIPTVPTGEAVVAMDNGEVDKETNDNTTDTVSKTDQSAEAADSDKTIAVTLRSDIDVENVISCRVDDRAMSEIDLSDQNEIPLPPPLAENGQQSEQGVDVAVTV